jgi:hypothetical protein
MSDVPKKTGSAAKKTPSKKKAAESWKTECEKHAMLLHIKTAQNAIAEAEKSIKSYAQMDASKAVALKVILPMIARDIRYCETVAQTTL